MPNQIAPIILTVSLILVITFQTLAQEKIEGLNLSVSIENTDFGLSRKPKVKVRLENKTENTIYLNKSEPIWLKFEKLHKPYNECTRSHCFVAFVSFKDKRVEKDKSIEAEFDLRDFYWMDAISSYIDLKRPKNFFETVRIGEYRFYASVRVPPNAWTFEESKLVRLTSNEVKVSV